MPSYFPILLAAHYPGRQPGPALHPPSFALRTRRAAVESGSPVVQSLLWAQSRTIAIGLGSRR
jgi:hypothetical protein